MDDFAVDLDKVLDDFELSEGAGAKSDSKLNHGSIPSLQPPATANNAYTSPQVAPLQPACTPTNANSTPYRQLPSFSTQYDITYQPQPHVDYSAPATHNPVICATVQADGHGETTSTNKPVSNSPMEVSRPCTLDSLSQTTTSTTLAQLEHNDNEQWGVVNNNNNIPPSYTYPTEGGVLAHGERSNGNVLRRLDDDRPELLQSTTKKQNALPPYPGEVSTSQGYHPGGAVVSNMRPDVVPVSLNNTVEMAHRPSSLEQPQNNVGVNCSYVNDLGSASNVDKSSDPTSPVQGHYDLRPVTNSQQADMSTNPSQGGTDSPVPQTSQQNSTEDMSVDSPPHSLQSDLGVDSTTERTRDNAAPSEAPQNTDSSQMCGVQSSDPPTDPKEGTVHNQPSTAPPQNDSGSQTMKSESQTRDVVVGFGGMEDEDIADDEMDAYLAGLETTDSAKTTNAPLENKRAACPNSLQFDSSRMATSEEPDRVSSENHEPNRPSFDLQGSGGNVEKFLAPPITSPRIATPFEDAGFTKVPGYVPPSHMSCLTEDPPIIEEDEDETDKVQPSTTVEATARESQVGMIMAEQVNAAVSSENKSAGSEESYSATNVAEPTEKVDSSNSETDCVMLRENAKEDTSGVGVGAITVSFPVQQKVQPMDTTGSASDVNEATNSAAGTGARPKENTQRKSRPNSLLGLSKPDLNITVPVSYDSGYSDSAGNTAGPGLLPGAASSGCLEQTESSATSSVVENSHDIINRQLAQKARSPLQKKQLNLEIKQHLDNAAAQRSQMDSKTTVENSNRRSLLEDAPPAGGAAVSVVTNRAQLASGIGITLPAEASPLRRPDSGIPEDIMSSSSSSSLQSLQAPSPARAANTQPTTELANVNDCRDAPPIQDEQQYQSQQNQEVPIGAEGHGEMNINSSDEPESEQSKLKRPTSLSLMPRAEFQINQDKDSTEDDSVTGDGGYASSGGSSSGHLTPFQADDEMSEPPGATASGPGADMLYSPPEVGPGAFSPAPRCSSNLNVVITQLGKVAPRWVPDAEACNCMQCEARFTFTKRRHHCRACGKVFCSACCNLKCKLQYMDNKEARVCSKCYQDIVRAQAYERMHSPNRSPNPNNPAEYCSTIPPLQQAAASLHAPPPTVMVPVGVLRKEGSQRNREPKQVMFSDGIRPGGDLTELDGSDARIPIRRSFRSSKKVERMAAAAAAAAAASDSSSDTSAKSPSPKTRVKRLSEPSLRHACLIPDVGLPPVIMSTGVKGDFTLEEDPSMESIMPKIRSTEDPNPVVFAINKNLFVLVKIVNLDCCVNRVCWCFSTKGMCTVGQDEVVIVLECLPDEKVVPRDIFCHLNSVYDEASKGNTVSHLGHTIFGQSFLDSRDHCGFLYVRPTFQCVQKLLLPQPPYVFGLLLQKWETPWAKVFPVRLMLRLGAEYRYYPCPLISVRFRKPVYGEIGHTIMNLLADFRNYQYMLPQIRGVVVHMEEKKTFINFPRNRYDEVMKVITNSNDHVMALGANFSTDADSHLVCIQNEDGNYQTQAINIQNKPRKVTGASFVVFNGALKTSSGLRAKSSIVEDGLMVQITTEAMGQLKAALLDMKDFTISCGALDAPNPEEQVIVQWTEDDHRVNQGVKSPIDGLPMDGIESIHIHNGTDYVGETRTIRWTEVFFIQNEDASNSRCEPVDLSRLAETLAQACCIALTPHLDKLKEAGLTKIGLRCNIDRDRVGYEVGANGERLPDLYMNDLDNELIPVIHNAGTQSQDGPVVLELIFYIIE